MPFGYSVQPVVNMDTLTTQNFFLDLTEQSKILPYNAGFRWDGDTLVGVPGTDGRYLDVAGTMLDLQANMPLVASTGSVALVLAYVEALMPPSVVSRPIAGAGATIDLAIGLSRTNTSPVLKSSCLGRINSRTRQSHLATAAHPADNCRPC